MQNDHSNLSIQLYVPIRKETKRNRLFVIAPLVVLVLGVVMIGYSLLHFYLQHKALTLSRSQVTALELNSHNRMSEPRHIYIQWSTDVDIEALPINKDIWGVSPDHATFLAQSARPGENGNIIIFGHNKREILGNIRALKGKELITITTKDGKTHMYQVSEVKEVSPDDISGLKPTNTEVLTMYTCSGPLDSLRFVVKALPYQS